MEAILTGIKHIFVAIAGAALLAAPKPVSHTPTPSPTPTPSSSINQTVNANNDQITVSGSYTYLGQEISYNVNVPKKGGKFNGSVSGLCNGTTLGTFDGGEGGKIQGTAVADCGFGFLGQSINLTYTGKLYPEKRSMKIDWTGEIPHFGNSGSFSYNY